VFIAISQPEIPMADRIDVEVTGKSKSEIAYQMAHLILVTLEQKPHYQGVTRKEYLSTVAQCVDALNGVGS
jgi:hypothetical protein